MNVDKPNSNDYMMKLINIINKNAVRKCFVFKIARIEKLFTLFSSGDGISYSNHLFW